METGCIEVIREKPSLVRVRHWHTATRCSGTLHLLTAGAAL